MGLSICRSIIESHGGRLWVTSDGEIGTVFRFTLPAPDRRPRFRPRRRRTRRCGS
jgi:signal transduction histidine kinase